MGNFVLGQNIRTYEHFKAEILVIIGSLGDTGQLEDTHCSPENVAVNNDNIGITFIAHFLCTDKRNFNNLKREFRISRKCKCCLRPLVLYL